MSGTVNRGGATGAGAAGIVVVALILALFVGMLLPAQQIDMSVAEAAEEFRWGVYAFHAGRYNDAIVAFSRALALQPDDYRVREWLGRAYFQSGFEDAAIGEWEIIADSDAAKAYLLSKIEMLRYRRGTLPLLEEDLDFSRSQRIPGVRNGNTFFRRPGGIAAEPRGDIFVASLGTNEIVRITPNGRIRTRLQGGLEGLDRPFDVAWADQRVYVTEFGRDRISVFHEDGDRLMTIGGSGLGEGELLGPQYIAVDGGFIYVTEWGNRRVSKFDGDGNFILSFGEGDTFFPGFSKPTGIAVDGDDVYVVDTVDESAVVHHFDGSGNYIRPIALPLNGSDAPEHGLTGNIVEDLGWYDDTHLMVTAGRRILLFHPEREEVVASFSDEERMRIGSAVRDANRRVVVSDFDADDIALFEPEGSLYAGLDVRVERIISREFPQIGVLVSIHDRDGRPLVGLEAQNFIISENSRPVNDIQIESTGTSVTTLNTVAVVQARPGQRYRSDAARGVLDLAEALPEGEQLSVYVAAEEPVLVARRPAQPRLFAERTSQELTRHEEVYNRGNAALDRALRLAASSLVEGGLAAEHRPYR